METLFPDGINPTGFFFGRGHCRLDKHAAFLRKYLMVNVALLDKSPPSDWQNIN
jgi:hypothetical protein